MTEIQKTWNQFYESRINSSYQEYFKKRYAIMIEYIFKTFSEDIGISEEGIGIGSLIKALHHHGFENLKGYDVSTQMVKLAERNLPKAVRVYCDDIFCNTVTEKNDVVITHGVLEHFSDDQIRSIFDRYKRNKNTSIHYVPLDKYVTPSFGDERLLPAEHWLKLVKPVKSYTFNNGCDLLLIK